MTMTTTPRMVPDRPSDAAIAQAFYEAIGKGGGVVSNDELADFIETRAREIAAAAPADPTIAHPSRGVVDEVKAVADRLLDVAGVSHRYSVDELAEVMQHAAQRLRPFQAAALPADPTQGDTP